METTTFSALDSVMDDAVLRVLDKYHRRINAEKERRRQEARGERAAGRHEGSHGDRMLAIGPQSGRFINIMARSLGAPRILELGTSFGYSTIWLADAARAAEGDVVTMELHEHKSEYARRMARAAGLSGYVEFQVGDAIELIDGLSGPFDFVLFDLWKDLYLPSFQKLKRKLRPGAILVADNMIYGGSGAGQKAYVDAVRSTPGMTSVLLPIGAGLEVSRFMPA